MNSTEKFYHDCGEIVLLATSIEYALGQYLTFFLLRPNSKNSFQLDDEFSDMSFDNKIKLLEKFCDAKSISSEISNKPLSTLKMIKAIRNKVAHWGATYDIKTDTFHLKNRKLSSEEQYLSASTAVKEVSEGYFVVTKGLADISNKLLSSG